MCRVGDIIVVKEFKDRNGTVVPKHSFVVISDEAGIIESYSYDFISNIMCSFHSENHKKRKLKIKSNLEIVPNKIKGRNVNNKTGYIRADDLFYFKKDKIDYKVIGRLSDDMLDKLIKLKILLQIYNLILLMVFKNIDCLLH